MVPHVQQADDCDGDCHRDHDRCRGPHGTHHGLPGQRAGLLPSAAGTGCRAGDQHELRHGSGLPGYLELTGRARDAGQHPGQCYLARWASRAGADTGQEALNGRLVQLFAVMTA
jgi:hypothetical protein